MTTPWLAILSGLGSGASTLGTSLQQDALIKAEQDRQGRLDALDAMLKNAQIGHLGSQSAEADARAKALAAPPLKPVAGMVKVVRNGQQMMVREDQMQPGDQFYESPPKVAPTTQDKLNARISELTRAGIPLEHASAQARLEFGEPPQVPPSATIPPGVTGPNGRPMIFDPKARTLVEAPEGVTGKTANQQRLPERSQQLGLGLQAAGQVLPIHLQMANNPPGLFSGAAAAEAQGGGARGEVGNWMLNKVSPQYAQYTDAMAGALLAAAHSVGGARINKEQVNMFGQQFRVRAGDGPLVNAQKAQSFVGFLNAAAATLPAEEVAKQEALMPAEQLAFLRAHGYGARPRAVDIQRLQSVMPEDVDINGLIQGARAGAPSGGSVPTAPGGGRRNSGNQTGNIDLREPTAQQAAWDRAAAALRSQGKAPETVIGPRP